MSSDAASYPTRGGHTTHTETHDESTIAWCASNCGSTRTYWGHLSTDPAAEARDWAKGHAAGCTVTTTGGRPAVADREERTVPPGSAAHNLERALDAWARATQGSHGDHAGHLRWDTDGRSLGLSLATAQTNRLARLLNVDTALITAHTAATQEN